MRMFMSMMSCCLASACAPLTTIYPSTNIVIDVRDAHTSQPIDHAVLLGSSQVMFYPEMQKNELGRPGTIPSFVAVNEPSGWHVETVNGTAHVTAAGGTPVSLTVMAQGYSTAKCVFTIDSKGDPVGQGFWNRGTTMPDDTAEGTLEFRVDATSTEVTENGNR